MIEVEQLVKHYGAHVAVDGVTFSAGKAEVLGLLGSNGAGKSSVMRVLVGYLTATSGRARVAGFDVADDSVEVRRRLGYLPENAGLYTEMRVIEYLGYRAELKGLYGQQARAAIDRVLDRCGLGHVRTRILEQLSKGYRQRVALAGTLLHDPEVLILDEPTVGLDPLQMREIRTLVRDLGKERTVLISTHILSEAEAVCDRVVIMDAGRVLADGDPRGLAARFRSQDLAVELVGPLEAAVAALEALPEVAVEVLSRGETSRVRLRVPNAASPQVRADISRALVAARCVPIELSFERTSLDEAFARITGDGREAALPESLDEVEPHAEAEPERVPVPEEIA